MTKTLPRISTVACSPRGWPTVGIDWSDGSSSTVNLGGWIKTGGPILAPLMDPKTFFEVQVGYGGTSLFWEDPDGDLAIDAIHLRKLYEEQQGITTAQLVNWQAEIGLSNQEAAEFLGIGLSTWNGYKAGATIPATVGMVCRAALRDPILMQAHYRPRKPGRPSQVVTAGSQP